MIAIQTIKTTWTKASRGGKLAERRNRVPNTLPLTIPEDFPSIIWHSVQFSERNEFATPCVNERRTHEAEELFRYAKVEILLQEKAAVLTFIYQSGGAPVRAFYSKQGVPVAPAHSITIPPRRWAAVEHNGRYAERFDGNWWYEHIVVNVALLPIPATNIFTSSPPIERYCQLAHLW